MLEGIQMQYKITIEYYRGLHKGQSIVRSDIEHATIMEAIKEITDYQKANADIYIGTDHGKVFLEDFIEHMYTSRQA